MSRKRRFTKRQLQRQRVLLILLLIIVPALCSIIVIDAWTRFMRQHQPTSFDQFVILGFWPFAIIISAIAALLDLRDIRKRLQRGEYEENGTES